VAALFLSKAIHLKAQFDWLDIGNWWDIANNSAKILQVGSDEKVAVFRYEQNKLAAISKVCQHQNGPLGEGQVRSSMISLPARGMATNIVRKMVILPRLLPIANPPMN
jgi:hypothetical protein